MKSILFTVLEDKLVSREKKQTFRTNFIPSYEITEMVMLRFKYKNGVEKDLYPVKIADPYPKQIKNLTLEEAHLDGFSNIKEFQKQCPTWHSVVDQEFKMKIKSLGGI